MFCYIKPKVSFNSFWINFYIKPKVFIPALLAIGFLSHPSALNFHRMRKYES